MFEFCKNAGFLAPNNDKNMKFRQIPVGEPVDNYGIARQPFIRARNQVLCRLAYCLDAMIAASRASSSDISPLRCAMSSGAPMALDDRRAGSQCGSIARASSSAPIASI